MLFVYQNFDNSVRKLNGSTLINSKGSDFSINSENIKTYELEKKIKILEKENRIYCEINEILIDDITELFVKIAKQSPEIVDFMKKQKETKRIISKLETIFDISDKKVLHNQDFFKFFERNYLNN